MKDNPYRAEIVGTFLMSALVLPLETWRRWGTLASPAALDDALVFGAAMAVAWGLARKAPAAPAWWVFVCGGGWMMFALSVWGSLYSFEAGDPSGAPVPLVVAFKLAGLALISAASLRALRRVRAHDPYAISIASTS